MAVVPLEEILREWERLGNSTNQVTVGDLVEIRHKLTANICENLFEGHNRAEGKNALTYREGLDDLILNETAKDAPEREYVGNSAAQAIILATTLELLGILDRAKDAGRGNGKGIKAEMQKLFDDPDRIGAFHDKDKATIRRIAEGSFFLAKARFDTLHEDLRRRMIPFTHPTSNHFDRTRDEGSLMKWSEADDIFELIQTFDGPMRLWFVVSVIWVLLVALFSWQDVAIQFQCSHLADAVSSAGGYYTCHYYRDTLWKAVITALIVPAFLFALGGAVRWIWRGFRRNR